jgi:lariat debranching enzyme
MTRRKGGWLCEDIYYIGQVGLINFRGVKIAGISGIFPKSGRASNSVTHYLQKTVDRLTRHIGNVDIFLSHDWPRNIVHYGPKLELLNVKSFLREEVKNGSFGSPAILPVLNKLQPSIWVAAHMHVYYECLFGRTVFIALNKNSRHRGWTHSIKL